MPPRRRPDPQCGLSVAGEGCGRCYDGYATGLVADDGGRQCWAAMRSTGNSPRADRVAPKPKPRRDPQALEIAGMQVSPRLCCETLVPECSGGGLQFDGIAEIFETADEAALDLLAVTFLKVAGAEVDVLAVVVEEMPDDAE